MNDEEYSVRTREWVVFVRSLRLGKPAKTVALAIAHYADSDGHRIFPGNARLAVECELSYGSVKAALVLLREVGLIAHVRRSMTSMGRAEEYRLIMHEDLLERLAKFDIEVLSPNDIRAAVDAMQRTRRGNYKPVAKEDLRPVGRTAEGGPDESLRYAGRTADAVESPVDNPNLRYVPPAADEPSEKTCGTSHDSRFCLCGTPDVPQNESAVRPTPPHQVLKGATTSTAQSIAGVRTGLAVGRVRVAEIPTQIFPVVNETGRRRHAAEDDEEPEPADAEVIHLDEHRRTA